MDIWRFNNKCHVVCDFSLTKYHKQFQCFYQSLLFYVIMPREFTSVVMVGVYIPPQANATADHIALADHIITVENSSRVLIGDFNRTTLSKDLAQYVKYAMGEGKTLDLCYSTISDA